MWILHITSTINSIYGTMVLIASNEKVKKELSWKPEFADIDTIISTAWNWHDGHNNGY